MVEDKKKEIPKHIKTYHENIEKEKKLIATTDHHHRFAYEHMTDKVLKDEKTGLIDPDLLKKSDVQLKAADEMADFYLDKALEHFGYKKPGEKLPDDNKLDVFQKDMLMKAYANTTKGELRNLFGQHQERLGNYGEFIRLKDRFMKPLIERLMSASMSHLKEEHIDDIINYTGVKDMVEREHMKIENAASLLRQHYELGGVLPKKELDNIIGEYAVKEKYRKGYDPKKAVEPDKKKKAA